jgi:FtsP/CotA-like multicopper oxidase with cupredoxin domain
MPSPPIVLTQHQSVDIRILNRLNAPTAVHWHGIELDSYYDGVPGVGGEGRQVTPPVAPGGSFIARVAPPRAGTFIYHTHWHDSAQLIGGLYGPLIVLPPGQTFDPETDKIVLIAASEENDSPPLLVNGTRRPSPMTLKVGTRYRFRFINIGANTLYGARVSFLDEGKPVVWRAIAKDGADLPASQQRTIPAAGRVMVGETFDFEFVPEKTGPLSLVVFHTSDKIVINVNVR